MNGEVQYCTGPRIRNIIIKKPAHSFFGETVMRLSKDVLLMLRYGLEVLNWQTCRGHSVSPPNNRTLSGERYIKPYTWYAIA